VYASKSLLSSDTPADSSVPQSRKSPPGGRASVSLALLPRKICVADFTSEGALKPVRKITNFAPGKVIGHFYSHKMSRHIPFESVPEAHFFCLLELDPEVVSYFAQPETIRYRLEGELRRYTPDVLVEHKSLSYIYYEVKPSRIAKHWHHTGKAEAIRLAFNDLGKIFIIVTTDFIEAQPQLNNCLFLHRYGGLTVPATVEKEIVQKLKEYGACSISTLAESLNLQSGLSFVYSLLFRNRLTFNKEELISPHTIVKLAYHG